MNFCKLTEPKKTLKIIHKVRLTLEENFIMNCLNCGSQLPGNSDICPHCGTYNDTDIYKEKNKKITSESTIKEDFAWGTGEVDEISKEIADLKLLNQLKTGKLKYRANTIRNNILSLIAGFFLLMIIAAAALGIYSAGARPSAEERIQDGIIRFKAGLIKSAAFAFGDATGWYILEYEGYYLKGVSFYYLYLNEKIKKEKDPSLITLYEENIKKSFEEAQKYRLLSDYPEVHYYMGLYYYEKGMFNKAADEFDTCIKAAEGVWKEEKKRSAKWIGHSKSMKKYCLELAAKDNVKTSKQVISPIIDISNNNILFLTEKDIISWQKILAALKNKKTPEEEIIWNFLRESTQKYLEDWNEEDPKAPLPNGEVLPDFNNIIKEKNLCQTFIYKDIEIPEKCKDFTGIGLENLTALQIRQTNRFILENIFSDMIYESEPIVKYNSIIPLLPDETENIE